MASPGESESAPLVASGDANHVEESAKSNPHLIKNVPEDEWIRRAKESEAGKSVESVLKDVASETEIGNLKDQMFKQVHTTLGGELMPEDMVRALVVKTEQYHPWLRTLLCICTLGVFECFRPRDDEAVVVLTKNERVSMYKVERVGFFSNLGVVVRMTFAIVGVYLAINFLPLLFLQLSSSGMLEREMSWVNAAHQGYEEHVLERMQRTLWLQAMVWAVCFVAFLFWVWTKLPHDYGVRSRQSHAANKVCAAQFSLVGGNWFRQCKLRLFFGRYPNQGAMDHNAHLNIGGGVVQIGDKQELSLTNLSSPFAGGGSRKSLFVLFIVFLNLCTLGGAVLTYAFTPYQMYTSQSTRIARCRNITEAEACVASPGSASLPGCWRWAQVNDESKESVMSYCASIEWILEDNSAAGDLCGYTEDGAKRTPPCCSGCFGGAIDSVKSQWIDVLGTLISFITDFGTLGLGLVAAASVMSYIDEKDHVDIVFKRRMNSYMTELSHFDLTQHLANEFLNAVMNKAFNDLRGSTAGAPKRDYRTMETGADPDSDISSEANFQDVTCFEIDNTFVRWSEFWGSGKVPVTKRPPESNKKDEEAWIPKVVIPAKCLGIHDDEHVIGAWVEMPILNAVLVMPLVLFTIVVWVGLLVVPDQDERFDFLRFQVFGDPHSDKIMSATIWSLLVFVILFVGLFCLLYAATKHVCIMTDLRLIYVRYTVRAVALLMFAPQMRIDSFRHDHELTYGSMRTEPLTLYQRCTRAPWTPGVVYMQPGFYGILKVWRQHGNVLNLYQVACQLTKPGEKPFIDGKAIEDAGISYKYCEQTVNRNMKQAASEVWTITHAQPDDHEGMMPDMYVSRAEEKPLFYWSFKQIGWIDSPHNFNTDVVVTTNRVYLYSRQLWKDFDMRVACCFTMCWCTWFWALYYGKKGLRRQSSFLDLRLLLSFSTEVEISPPVWYDPIRWPIKCPALDTCCRWCSLCLACRDRTEIYCNPTTCSCIPRRSGARATLMMMWRHRFNSTQRDLTCMIAPYAMPDEMLITDVMDRCCGKHTKLEDEEVPRKKMATPDFQRVELLRKIMGVVQDTANLKEKQADLPG